MTQMIGPLEKSFKFSLYSIFEKGYLSLARFYRYNPPSPPKPIEAYVI